MAYQYFLYSTQQLEFQTKIEKGIGRTYQPGVVFHKGKKHNFTELASSKESAMYSDSKVVAEGETSTMRYTMPKGV